MISCGSEPSAEAQPPGGACSSMTFSARRAPPCSDVYLITCAPLRADARFFSCARNDAGAIQVAVTASATAMCTTARRAGRWRWSELQPAQILIAPPDAGERVWGLVVLDEVVLDPGLLTTVEDRLPRDRARPHVDHAVLGWPAGVLDVDHREPARPAREVREGILTALRDPVEIHLERNVPRLATLEEDVVGNSILEGDELEGVVVIREAHPALEGLLADPVEEVGGRAIAVEGAPLLLGKPGHDDIPLTDGHRGIEHPRQLVSDGVDRHVGGRGDEPRLVERAAHRAGIAPVVSRELHLAEPDSGQLGEGSLEIPLQQGPDGVQLHADEVDPPGPGAAQPFDASQAQGRECRQEMPAARHVSALALRRQHGAVSPPQIAGEVNAPPPGGGPAPGRRPRSGKRLTRPGR